MDEFVASDIASTLYTIVNDLGDFIGPVLGGFLSSNYGFKNCCLILSIFIIIFLVIFILFFFKEIRDEMKRPALKDINLIREELDNRSILSNDEFSEYTYILIKNFECKKLNEEIIPTACRLNSSGYGEKIL